MPEDERPDMEGQSDVSVRTPAGPGAPGPAAGRVDPRSAEALTAQLVRILRARITDGDLRERDRMPSEHTLAAEQGVSRVTVRRALDRLARDGLVQPAQGRAWLIVPPEAPPVS